MRTRKKKTKKKEEHPNTCDSQTLFPTFCLGGIVPRGSWKLCDLGTLSSRVPARTFRIKR